MNGQAVDHQSINVVTQRQDYKYRGTQLSMEEWIKKIPEQRMDSMAEAFVLR